MPTGIGRGELGQLTSRRAQLVERAFYGAQYAAMAPLFEHHGIQLSMPEAGGRVDFASEHDERVMTVLGLWSKR